jgi:hypothetical protein
MATSASGRRAEVGVAEGFAQDVARGVERIVGHGDRR